MAERPDRMTDFLAEANEKEIDVCPERRRQPRLKILGCERERERVRDTNKFTKEEEREERDRNEK